MKQVWDELKTSCDFARMRQEAASFNRQNRWRKRGVAMVPTKFGISFTSAHLNQVSFAPTSLSVSLIFYNCCVFKKSLPPLPVGLSSNTAFYVLCQLGLVQDLDPLIAWSQENGDLELSCHT